MLSGMPAAVIGASPGRGGAGSSREQVHKSLGRAGAVVFDETYGITQVHGAMVDDTRFAPEHEQALDGFLTGFVDFVARAAAERVPA